MSMVSLFSIAEVDCPSENLAEISGIDTNALRDFDELCHISCDYADVDAEHVLKARILEHRGRSQGRFYATNSIAYCAEGSSLSGRKV